MLSVSEAISQLVASAKPAAAVESLSVLDSLGRVLALDICAAVDVPPADNSAMDGYAFCGADAEANNFVLPLGQRIPAGTAPESLTPSTAARIFTGGEIPAGADRVAIQENCKAVDGSVTLDVVGGTGNFHNKNEEGCKRILEYLKDNPNPDGSVIKLQK
mgnify:CR=1 FL=1